MVHCINADKPAIAEPRIRNRPVGELPAIMTLDCDTGRAYEEGRTDLR
jgi:hypothetical protein